MSRFTHAILFGAILIGPLSLAPTALQAQDRKYHDKAHNDDHEWNDHENQAYRMWVKEKHRKDVDFEKLRDKDQQSYWAWRHDHSDSVLKIDIH